MYVKPMNLDDMLGHHIMAKYQGADLVQELFGVEVELEGTGGIANPTQKVIDNWLKHNDGSLRQISPGDEAIEYVLKRPLNLVKAGAALSDLMKFLTEPGKKVYDSYRTSIHVHVNCLADKLIHVYNFITLCIIFDELLASQNGDHRIGNNFCLRARDAQGQIDELILSIEEYGNIFSANGQHRYSSINFVSLMKFGTVEFRSLECTTDLNRILDWVKVINNLKVASRTFKDPQEIIRSFSHMNVKAFVDKILGDRAHKYTSVPGYEHMLFDGMRLAQDFAFSSKWINKVKVVTPKADKIEPWMQPPQVPPVNNAVDFDLDDDVYDEDDYYPGDDEDEVDF